MITGYNTDVKHRERVFHVQTEDKGTNNPYIETLIYVGGQVLSAERTSYAEIVEQGFDRKAVSKMMDEQHQAMIAAIKNDDHAAKVRELFGDPEPGDDEEGPDRTLDEVILEYLTTEAQQDHLMLFLDEEAELALGEAASLVVRASSSKSGMPVPGAEVTVKMISTADQPRVLSTGATLEDGRIRLEMSIPEIVEGSSALIITADSSIGKAELKYLL